MQLNRKNLPQTYLKASFVGTIVKYYTKQKFYTFDTIDFVYSYIKWTREEKDKYSKWIYQKLGRIFEAGKYFEANEGKEMILNLPDEFGNDVITYDQNGFYNEKLKLYGIPDYYSSASNTIYECKNSKSSTKSFNNYIYQLVTYDILLEKQSSLALVFNDDIKKLGENIIASAKQDIIESIQKFWQDFENEKFKYISADDFITNEVTKEKEQILVQDLEMNETISELADLKIVEKDTKAQIKDLENKVKSVYNTPCKLETNDGVELTLYYTIKEPVKMDIDYYEKEINELQAKILDFKEKINEINNGKEVEYKERSLALKFKS